MKHEFLISLVLLRSKIYEKIIFLGLALVSLTACSSVQHKDPTPPKLVHQTQLVNIVLNKAGN